MAIAHFYPRAQIYIDKGLRTPFDLFGYLGQTLDRIDDKEPDIIGYLDVSYAHGGGWNDFQGFVLHGWDSEKPTLAYPGDSPTDAVCYWQVGDTRVILFDHAWVAVVGSDTQFRISRMD